MVLQFRLVSLDRHAELVRCGMISYYPGSGLRLLLRPIPVWPSGSCQLNLNTRSCSLRIWPRPLKWPILRSPCKSFRFQTRQLGMQLF